MTTETFQLEGMEFCGVRIPTAHTAILLIQGKKASLGCGYFSLAPAEKTGDRFAIVRGVKCVSDLLEVPVAEASPAALECGVVPGMTGREALLLMEKN